APQNVGLLVKQGEFKKVRCLSATGNVSPKLCGFAQASLAAKGVTDFKNIFWPPGTTAFQPYASKVLADGADAVVVAISDAGAAPVLQALADAGANVTALAPSTSIGSKSIDVAKKNNIPLRVAGSWAVDPARFKGRQEMLDNVQRYSKAVGAPATMDTTSDNAFNIYQGIVSLAAVMNGAKSLKT